MQSRPQLADFGASDSDLRAARTVRRWLVATAILGDVAVFAAAVSLAEDGTPWPLQVPGVVLLLAFCPPWGLVLSHRLAMAAARSINPSFRRADTYDRANKQYETWWVRTQQEFWLSLSGHAFEAELAGLYGRLGYKAALTSAEGDRGVDLWVTIDGERTPVQCKAHRRPVTPGAARELCGTMQAFGARRGVLASVSGFTTGTVQFSSAHGIQLLDLAGILAMQRRVGESRRVGS